LQVAHHLRPPVEYRYGDSKHALGTHKSALYREIACSAAETIPTA